MDQLYSSSFDSIVKSTSSPPPFLCRSNTARHPFPLLLVDPLHFFESLHVWPLFLFPEVVVPLCCDSHDIGGSEMRELLLDLDTFALYEDIVCVSGAFRHERHGRIVFETQRRRLMCRRLSVSQLICGLVRCVRGWLVCCLCGRPWWRLI